MIEEIKFTKVPCSSEAILEKYDSHYSRGGSIAPFDFESARQAILSGIDVGMNKQTQEQKNTLQKILSKCWEPETNLIPVEQQQFNDIVKEREGRRLFCECFNVYRKKGLFVLNSKAYYSIGKLLLNFMNYAQEDLDYPNIMATIILSETFYTTQTDKEGMISKMYLQEALSQHPCFKSEKFWEAVMEHPLNGGGSQEAPEDETPEERKFREASEMFSRLGTYAHNMLQFGMHKEAVEKIIFKYADAKELSEQYKSAIKVWYCKESSNLLKRRRVRRRVWCRAKSSKPGSAKSSPSLK
eukprot:TRINITY_DN1143_c0_g1_i3.p1 TRINITY_DN1143_c0_g1~~TRINITY_DN1143_c0_g1_i3.p1  ORF type:complete len:298 (-),score=87.03 TRINITY_DN1143_c0_g1_i3:207-1100(-)